MSFLDYKQRRTTVGRTPLDEWPARRRDLYLTTHNTHNRQTSMPPVGFEPTTPAGERPQTYAGEEINRFISCRESKHDSSHSRPHCTDLSPVPTLGLHCRCLVLRFSGSVSDLFCVRSNDRRKSIPIWKRRTKEKSQYNLRYCFATKENCEKNELCHSGSRPRFELGTSGIQARNITVSISLISSY